MQFEDDSKNALQARFQELNEKYQNALEKDLHFEEVKKIYQQLQKIKSKLIELNKKHNDNTRLN